MPQDPESTPERKRRPKRGKKDSSKARPSEDEKFWDYQPKDSKAGPLPKRSRGEKDSLLGGKKAEDSAQRLAPVGEVIGKGLARGACEDGTVADIPRTREESVRAKTLRLSLRWAVAPGLCLGITFLASIVTMLLLVRKSPSAGKKARHGGLLVARAAAGNATEAAGNATEAAGNATADPPGPKGVPLASRLALLVDASCVIEIDSSSGGYTAAPVDPAVDTLPFTWARVQTPPGAAESVDPSSTPPRPSSTSSRHSSSGDGDPGAAPGAVFLDPAEETLLDPAERPPGAADPRRLGKEPLGKDSEPKQPFGRNWHAASTRWRVTVNSLGLEIRSRADSALLLGQKPEEQLDQYLQSHALLCTIQSSRGPARGNGLAFLSMADSWSYITRSEKHGLKLWDAFAARLEYAELHGMRHYMLLGKPTLDELTLQESDEVPESTCADEGQGFHVMKAIAMLRVLDLDSDLEAVTFLDADTLPSNLTITPRTYLSMHPDADFIGTSNQRLPIFVNGGVWILRNTDWGKRLMQKWWANRCGFADQGALWHSIFELWAAEVEDFKYDPRLFESYDATREKVLQLMVDSAALQEDALARSPFSCHGKCREILRSSGCLTEALLMPHVLLLPVVPTVLPGRDEVAYPLQHHMGTAQWICHFDTMTSPHRCWGEAYAFDVIRAEDQPESHCRGPVGSRYGFGCDCHALLKRKKGKKR